MYFDTWDHTLVVIKGKLWVYGDNHKGQLGLGYRRHVMEFTKVILIILD